MAAYAGRLRASGLSPAWVTVESIAGVEQRAIRHTGRPIEYLGSPRRGRQCPVADLRWFSPTVTPCALPPRTRLWRAPLALGRRRVTAAAGRVRRRRPGRGRRSRPPGAECRQRPSPALPSPTPTLYRRLTPRPLTPTPTPGRAEGNADGKRKDVARPAGRPGRLAHALQGNGNASGRRRERSAPGERKRSIVVG